MTKKYLYFQIEIVAREFPSRFLEAISAASNHFEVIIAPLHVLKNLISKNLLPPGIIHTKDANYTPNYLKEMEVLKSKGFVITAHDEECGILQKEYKYFYNFRLSELSFKYIEKFFCWGQRDYNFIHKKIKIDKKKVELSGSTRVDIWKSGLSQVDIDNPIIKKFKGKIILISSNIASVLAIRSLSERVHNIYNTDIIETDEIMLKREFEVQAVNTLLLHEYIKLIKFLLYKLKDYLIVLRPHPTENKEDWQKLLNINSKKLLISDTHSLIDWINISKIVINSGCTASLESYFAKKIIINFNPNINYISQIRDDDVEIATNIGFKFETKEQIVAFISSIKEKNNFTENNNIAEELNFRVLNKPQNNFTKFISTWEQLIIEKKLYSNLRINYNKIKERKSFISYFKKIIKNFIFNFYPLSNKIKHPFEHKFPNFKINEIKNLQKILTNKFKLDKKIKVQVLDSKILRVFSDNN